MAVVKYGQDARRFGFPPAFFLPMMKGGGYEILVDDGREIVSRTVDRELGEAVLIAVQVAAFRVLDRATRGEKRDGLLARAARRRPAAHPGQVRRDGPGRAAARELVAERWLTSELAEAAMPEAIAFAARGGRSG